MTKLYLQHNHEGIPHRSCCLCGARCVLSITLEPNEYVVRINLCRTHLTAFHAELDTHHNDLYGATTSGTTCSYVPIH